MSAHHIHISTPAVNPPLDAMGHWFDEDLTCLCGVSWYEHQQDRQRCQGRKYDDVHPIEKCVNGHPRTPEHAKRHTVSGRVVWRCMTCRRLWNRERKRRERNR